MGLPRDRSSGESGVLSSDLHNTITQLILTSRISTRDEVNFKAHAPVRAVRMRRWSSTGVHFRHWSHVTAVGMVIW